MYGYLGKLLRVDLSAGNTWDEPLNQTYARDFVGGSGLAARYAYDMIDAQSDPLAPVNPLILMTGPLVGTAMPSAGRFSVCALSPATDIWGEANSGGFWGPELRFAGYDGIIITGQAENPLWLSIVDGHVQLHPAGELWGLDSYQTQDRVRDLLGEAQARVACIGQAGENGVKMAAVMNDHGRAAGRTGMGAVMGSKKLKAIAVRGTARTVPVAQPDELARLAREIVQGLNEDMMAMSLRLAGTAGYVDMALMYGDAPIRYFQQGEWERAGNLSGVLMADQYQNRRVACYRCPIACGRETRAPRYDLSRVDGPEFETLMSLGSLLMIDDLEAVIAANHLCNRYGLDTISAGSTIALACELEERGILTPADTGGLTPRYGDPETVFELLRLLAMRQDFGALLAQGNAALAERFGVPELTATVNRLEVPMHDPRAFSGMAAIYALSPRGACHMQGDMYGVDTGQNPPIELGILPGDRFDSSEDKGHIAARHQVWRTLYNALTICQFQNPGVERLLQAINAVTGWHLQENDLLTIGRRILTLKRLFNLHRGLTRADERLPALLTRPLDGGSEGNVPNLDTLLAGAYDELGWDITSGKPARETLQNLRLD